MFIICIPSANEFLLPKTNIPPEVPMILTTALPYKLIPQYALDERKNENRINVGPSSAFITRPAAERVEEGAVTED